MGRIQTSETGLLLGTGLWVGECVAEVVLERSMGGGRVDRRKGFLRWWWWGEGVVYSCP